MILMINWLSKYLQINFQSAIRVVSLFINCSNCEFPKFSFKSWAKMKKWNESEKKWLITTSCNHKLLFFVIYHCKLDICGFWTFGQTKPDNWRRHLWPCRVTFGNYFSCLMFHTLKDWLINQIMIIIIRIIDMKIFVEQQSEVDMNVNESVCI